jgi:hypothetical protein
MPIDDRKWFLVDIDCHTHIQVAIKTHDEELAKQDAKKLVDDGRIDLTNVTKHGGTDSTEFKATQLRPKRVPSNMLRFHEVSWGQLERM